MSPEHALHTAAAAEGVEERLSSAERLGLLIYFVGAFAAMTRVTFATLLGDWFLGVATAAVPVAAVGVMWTTLYGVRRSDVESASRRTVTWAQLVLAHVALLSVFGFVNGNLPPDITRDAIPYAVIAMFAVLGHRASVWRFAENTALWATLAAVPVAIFGLDLSDIAGRGSVQSEAYRTQGVLGLWPLLLLALPGRPPGWRRLAMVGLPFFVLGEQVLFLKRAPTVRVALVIVLLLFVVPALARVHRRGNTLLIAGAITALLAVGIWGETFVTAATSLGDRFEGSSGISATLVDENSRITEALAWADSTGDIEWVVGRGMGSYFTHVDILNFVLSEVDAQATFARRNLHIGILEPIFRGGVLFWLLYFGGFIVALGRTGIAIQLARAGEENSRTLGGAMFLYVYVTFQLTEGAASTSWYFDLAVVGLALGRLLSSGTRSLR